MVEAAYRTNAGIVTPKVVAYEDPLVLLHVGQTCDRFGVVRERVELGEIDHGQQDLERDVFVAPGGVTLVRADLFAALRGFDPLITVLGEDLDLCWRAQVAGARIVVAPLAKVAHRETMATGERPVTAPRDAPGQPPRPPAPPPIAGRGDGLVAAHGTVDARGARRARRHGDGVALVGGDTDRAGAIVGSWRWLLKHRRRVRQRRRTLASCACSRTRSSTGSRWGGRSRLKHFVVTLAREGYDQRARHPAGRAPSRGRRATPRRSAWASPRPSPRTRSSTRSPRASCGPSRRGPRGS